MKKKISVKQFDYDYFKKYEINNTSRILGGLGCSFNSKTYTEDVNTPGDDRGSNQDGKADDGVAGKEDATTKTSGTTPPEFATSVF